MVKNSSNVLDASRLSIVGAQWCSLLIRAIVYLGGFIVLRAVLFHSCRVSLVILLFRARPVLDAPEPGTVGRSLRQRLHKRAHKGLKNSSTV